MTVQTVLKYERKRRRLSQQKLATMAGLQQWHVSLIERCLLIPTEAQRASLAAALDIDPVHLVYQVVDVNTPPTLTEEQAQKLADDDLRRFVEHTRAEPAR